MKTITLFIQRSFTRPTKLQHSWSVVGLLTILFAAGLTSSQAQNTWTQKADFGGTIRFGTIGFSIGSKGYMGTGLAYVGGFQKDFWEYNPATDTWTQKADFEGSARSYAVCFSIGEKGYVGTGLYAGNQTNFEKDFWEYDPSTNNWSQKADFGGSARYGAVGFSIGEKGYVGTGIITPNGSHTLFKDFWEYDPASDTWTQKSDFGGNETNHALGFSIGTKGYICGGSSFANDFWEYDPSTNAWAQKANFGGEIRYLAAGFSIGNKGYVGTGLYLSYKKDFWEYDPVANTWTQKANFGGSGRYSATGFSIDSNGYIGAGYDGSYKNDFWEYTPGTGPSCIVPVGITTVKITGTTAKLKWDAVAGAEGYKIRYKVSGTDPWTLKYSNGNSKTLNNLSSNTNYTWEVKTYCTINPGLSSDWSAKQKFTTGSLRMGDESVQQVSFQIYPNPAEDHATIQFTLAQTSHVSIKVYDVSGKEIANLFNDDVQQGDFSLHITTNHFPKGVYMVRMISEIGIENQKLIVQ